MASANVSADQRNIHTLYIWAIASIAALGGLLFGYDWVVIGGAKPFYEAYFHLDSSRLIGWANSCALLGCLFGSFLAGTMNQRYGRKQILLAAGTLFAISSVCTGWASSFDVFIAWRIVGGIAIGLASNISPTYIAEIAPPEWRGRLVSLNQLAIVCGIMAAQLANWRIAENVPDHATMAYIAASWNGQYGWRWMFTAGALPAIIFVVCLIFIPESPRWLASKARTEKAFQVLAGIGGDGYARQALGEINESLAGESQHSTSWRQLFAPQLRFVLFIGIGLAILQQWSGINILFNYAEEVYKSAGYGVSAVLFNIVITGVVNLVFTLLSMMLVDRFGRRMLLLLGCCGIGIARPSRRVCLPRTSRGRLRLDAHIVRDCVLCNVSRPCHLGRHLGDISQSPAQRWSIGSSRKPLGGVLFAHLQLPPADELSQHVWHLPALRHHLPSGCHAGVQICP